MGIKLGALPRVDLNSSTKDLKLESTLLEVKDSGRDSGNFLSIDEMQKVAEMPLP